MTYSEDLLVLELEEEEEEDVLDELLPLCDLLRDFLSFFASESEEEDLFFSALRIWRLATQLTIFIIYEL